MKYMLDTNAVTCFIKNNQTFIKNLSNVKMSQVCISSVTLGELYFGLAKRPNLKLKAIITAFIDNVDVLPWDENIAEHYGKLRASLTQQGKVLAPLDMMIAAHAFAINATLVTNDGAFNQVSSLCIEDWTK